MDSFWPFVAGCLVGFMVAFCVLFGKANWYFWNIQGYREEQRAFYEQQNAMYTTLDKVLEGMVRAGLMRVEVQEKKEEPEAWSPTI